MTDKARLQGTSITGLLNQLISDYLATFVKSPVITSEPKEKKTGRGNIDWVQIEKAKELMRMRKPEGVRLQDIAEHVGVSNARARGLIDILSDTHTQRDFLVYEDYDVKPTGLYPKKYTLLSDLF